MNTFWKKPIAARQKTIKKAVSISGRGLFTGQKAEVRLLPSKENSGLVFRRLDLPGKPFYPVNLENVEEKPNCTSLGRGDSKVQTVEHLLSAVYAFGISNLVMEIDGPEVPIGDGSARIFIEALESSGCREQKAGAEVLEIKKPVSWSEKEIYLTALPSKIFKVSYALHYPDSNILRDQFCSFAINEKTYKKDIGHCRTFALFEHIKPLLDRGLLKGGGLHNAVIIKDDGILNPEGVRFENEMARHKIMDLIGDLALIGLPLLGHIIAIRSGHASNISFARKLMKTVTGGHN